MGGRPGEKEVDRKPVFPQTVLENQYSLLTWFYFIGLTKTKIKSSTEKVLADFGEGHEKEEVYIRAMKGHWTWDLAIIQHVIRQN